MAVFLVILGTFALCFALDKGFTRLFRSQPQHLSGKSVRLHKFYGLGGVLLVVLGISALFAGIRESVVPLIPGGILVMLLGIFLGIYYLTFGVYYDEKSFLIMRFGKCSAYYRFEQIKGQKLYNNGGQILIELYLSGGDSLQLQSTMVGVYEFMDHAFAAWCDQRGKKPEDHPFHDPGNSLWFPTVEE